MGVHEGVRRESGQFYRVCSATNCGCALVCGESFKEARLGEGKVCTQLHWALQDAARGLQYTDSRKNITKGKESCSKYLQQVNTAIPPSFSVRLISMAPAAGSGKKKIPKFVTLASNAESPNFRSWPLITAALTLLFQPLERIWACMMSIMSGEASTQRIWAEG